MCRRGVGENEKRFDVELVQSLQLYLALGQGQLSWYNDWICDESWFVTRQEKEMSYSLAVESTQHPYGWLPAVTAPAVRRPGLEADLPPPSSALQLFRHPLIPLLLTLEHLYLYAVH